MIVSCLIKYWYENIFLQDIQTAFYQFWNKLWAILNDVILGRDYHRFLWSHGVTKTLRFALFLVISSSSPCKSRATQRACFLFNSILDYFWSQQNFKGSRSILMYLTENTIYTRQLIYFAARNDSIFYCVWMKNASLGPSHLIQMKNTELLSQLVATVRKKSNTNINCNFPHWQQWFKKLHIRIWNRWRNYILSLEYITSIDIDALSCGRRDW